MKEAWLLAATALLLLAACGGGGADRATPARLSPAAVLGERIFHDVSLSATGRLACATCHDPGRAHAPDNGLAVQLGGPAGDLQGARSAGSLRYLAGVRPFAFDADGTPVGGLFWDGRAPDFAAQARQPLLDPREMANADAAEVAARLARTAYADDFRRLYGAAIFEDAEAALQRAGLALQAYQREDPEFRPFSSRYDDFLRGTGTLGEQELRGLALFNAPGKGNCAACHPSARGADGSLPLFTDFSYDALGVPRNPQLAANADPAHYDLGLCERAELRSRRDLCGAFRVPSLRNVAERRALFHNGRFSTLKEALTFYVQRDTSPEKWYPRDATGGAVQRFDDLPPELRANVNTTEAPYDRRPGAAPALSDAEIDDVIAFLKTLSDRPASTP